MKYFYGVRKQLLVKWFALVGANWCSIPLNLLITSEVVPLQLPLHVYHINHLHPNLPDF